MSVYNKFFGTCYFCILEWLEYILGEMTWNKTWGPFLLQEKVWQCWYVVKAAILIMISLGWLFQKIAASDLFIMQDQRVFVWPAAED